MLHRFGFRIAAAALLFLIVAACTDRRDITAPNASKYLTLPGSSPNLPIETFWSIQFGSISAGGYHTCARKNNGSIYCWGLDTAGAAGVANARCEYWSTHQVPCVNRPQYVMTGNAVAAGHDHTCALNTAGAAYCWGDGLYGALGNNAAVQPSAMNTTPSPVFGGLTFSSIGAGYFSSCGVNATALYCWGSITVPQLASMGWTGANQPVQMVSWTSSPQFTRVSVGNGYACGPVVFAGIGQDFCVGSNSAGQMGYDPSTTPFVPLGQAVGIPATGIATSNVSAHANFTCWDQTNGTVQCAGEGDEGQLGNGSPLGTPNGVGSFIPITVGNGKALSGVSAGRSHACALDPNGQAWCWGMIGLLGDGEAFPTSWMQAQVKGPVLVSGGITFRALAAGDTHTCGIGTDNHIYCWGSNLDGQLGNGTWSTAPALTPVQAIDPTT